MKTLTIEMKTALPSGRKGRLRLYDQQGENCHHHSIKVDVKVIGDDPLSQADINALACKVLNISAKRQRQLGCTVPFKYLRSFTEIADELKAAI